MQYVEPKYSRVEVNAAGTELITPLPPVGPLQDWLTEQYKAYDVVNNWRASHSRPLNTFYVTLNRRAKQVAKGVIVAQRLKRLDSITRKLSALGNMRLTQMQDIAGCRAVLPDMAAVRKLEALYRSTDFSHALKSSKDYVGSPKLSGYRSVHLIFGFKLRRVSPFEGHKVEIQIRTQLQHAWATAVEAAGTFTNQALKSSQGTAEWQRFFVLMSSFIAQLEGCPSVPTTPDDISELRQAIRELATTLNVVGVLRAYSATLQQVDKLKNEKYYLLNLDPSEQVVRLTTFTAAQAKEANDAYTDMEKNVPKGSNQQVVLVSVQSLQALRQAYPNYFLDTSRFVGLVQQAVG